MTIRPAHRTLLLLFFIVLLMPSRTPVLAQNDVPFLDDPPRLYARQSDFDFNQDGVIDGFTPYVGYDGAGRERCYMKAIVVVPGAPSAYTLTSGEPDDLFGVSRTSVGDLDDDGWDEVAVGALPGFHTNTPGLGVVRVFSTRDGSFVDAFVADPQEHCTSIAMMRVADLSGDGRDDLAIAYLVETAPGIYGFEWKAVEIPTWRTLFRAREGIRRLVNRETLLLVRYRTGRIWHFDMNGDRRIDMQDLSVFVEQWATRVGCNVESALAGRIDITDDGIVGMDDISGAILRISRISSERSGILGAHGPSLCDPKCCIPRSDSTCICLGGIPGCDTGGDSGGPDDGFPEPVGDDQTDPPGRVLFVRDAGLI